MILFISPKYGSRADSVTLIQASRGTSIHPVTLLNTWDRNKELNLYGNRQEQVAPYGEHAFCEFIAQELHLNLFSNSLDWVARLHKSLLKRKVHFVTLNDIIEADSETRSILGFKLLEPADDICFPTGVYTEKFPRVPRDTKILVHDEVEWQVKYRFLVVDGKIKSYCCFKVSNIFNDPTIYETKFIGKQITAEAFANTVISYHNTAPACILDVGFIKDVGWAVCGSYPVWSSSLYGLDPLEFLRALFVSCVPIE